MKIVFIILATLRTSKELSTLHWFERLPAFLPPPSRGLMEDRVRIIGVPSNAQLSISRERFTAKWMKRMKTDMKLMWMGRIYCSQYSVFFLFMSETPSGAHTWLFSGESFCILRQRQLEVSADQQQPLLVSSDLQKLSWFLLRLTGLLLNASSRNRKQPGVR